MTEVVVSVAEDTQLTEIVQLMEHRRIKRLPMLRGDALVGILSRADFQPRPARQPEVSGLGTASMPVS